MSGLRIAQRPLADRALEAELAAAYLDGLRWLLLAWGTYQAGASPGPEHHERVALFLDWSLGELAQALRGEEAAAVPAPASS